MSYQGDYPEDSTVRIMFPTFATAGGAVDPSDAFENSDFKIYKNGSTTEKSTANGVTFTGTFDTVTGLQYLEIDTSNDTGDAGFWTSGSIYHVVLDPDTETLDGEAPLAVWWFTLERMAKNIWDATVSNHTTSSTFGKKLDITGQVASESWVTQALYDAGLPKSYRNTYYVSTTGNNGNNGTGSGTPWLTLSYALSQCVSGDRVVVADGTYNSENFQVNGEFDTEVLFQAENVGGAIIQNNSGDIALDFDGGETHNFALQGFKFKLRDGAATTSNVIRFDDVVENVRFIDCEVVPADDAASTDNLIENNANGHINNLTFIRMKADMSSAGTAKFARLSHRVGNTTWLDCRITDVTGMVMYIDDFYGTQYVRGGRWDGSGSCLIFNTPLAIGRFDEERTRIVVEGADIVSTGAGGIDVVGSDAYRVSADVRRNNIVSVDSSVYCSGYVSEIYIEENEIQSNGSEPTVACSADGVTGEISAAYVGNNRIRNQTGHALILGQNISGANVLENDVWGGDQGIVIKGDNIRCARNRATTESGSCILVKGGLDVSITDNKTFVHGTSGTHRCIDIRQQEAGTLSQRDPDRIVISGNDMFVSGSAAQGFFLDSSNVGNEIREQNNHVRVKDSATAASIRGTSVTSTSAWNTAYSAYALTENGLFSTVDQMVADVDDQVDANATAIAGNLTAINALNDLSSADMTQVMTDLNLDKLIVTTGVSGFCTGTSFAMTGGTGFSDGDLVGNVIGSTSSGNKGQYRRILTATISGDNISGTVDRAWNNNVNPGVPMLILPDGGTDRVEAAITDLNNALVIVEGSGAGSGSNGFSITDVSALGPATDDLVGCLVEHVNSGQVRTITDADISGNTLNGNVTPNWNSVPGLGATFRVLPANSPTTAEITAAMLAMTTETGLTFKQLCQAMFATLGGLASGLETTTATFKGKDETTNRVVATVDANGNRSAITFTFE